MEFNASNLLWFFVLLFMMNGNGNFFGGNRGGVMPMPMPYPPPATQTDVVATVNNQSILNELNALGLATANNNYETARLISDQNMFMQNQNNTNLINVIQGFNNILLSMQNQTAQLGSKMDALDAKMASCCCEIKTQMLQDKLAEAQAKIVAQQTEISNNRQTQDILAQLGRWVANPPVAAA